jgi:hypothetical protein
MLKLISLEHQFWCIVLSLVCIISCVTLVTYVTISRPGGLYTDGIEEAAETALKVCRCKQWTTKTQTGALQ